MEVPKQKDIRNEQLELELFPEEATESPGQGQSEMTAEKEPERKSSDERAIRNGDIALRNETMSFKGWKYRRITGRQEALGYPLS